MGERLIAMLLRQQFVMIFEKYALDITIITAACNEEFYVFLPQNWTLEAAVKSEIIIQIKYLCTIELYRQELFYPNQSTDREIFVIDNDQTSSYCEKDILNE